MNMSGLSDFLYIFYTVLEGAVILTQFLILQIGYINKLVLRATPFQLMIDIHSAVAICMCILKNSL